MGRAVRVEFDWQVGAEGDETETLARAPRRRRPAVRWWRWVLVATVATAILALALLEVCPWAQPADGGVAFLVGNEGSSALGPVHVVFAGAGVSRPAVPRLPPTVRDAPL